MLFPVDTVVDYAKEDIQIQKELDNKGIVAQVKDQGKPSRIGFKSLEEVASDLVLLVTDLLVSNREATQKISKKMDLSFKKEIRGTVKDVSVALDTVSTGTNEGTSAVKGKDYNLIVQIQTYRMPVIYEAFEVEDNTNVVCSLVKDIQNKKIRYLYFNISSCRY